MNPELQETYSTTQSIAQEQFGVILQQEIAAQKQFLKDVIAVQDGFIKASLDAGDMVKALEKCRNYKVELFEIVDKRFTITRQNNFDVDFLQYNQNLEKYIKSLDEQVKRPEDPERFIGQKDDSIAVRFLKWFKKLSFKLSKWPEHISNFFRKLFKKPKRDLQPWVHKVHNRNLAFFYLKERLSAELTILFQDVYLKISKSSRLVWRVDEEIETAITDFIEKEDHSFTIDPKITQKAKTEIKGLDDFELQLMDQLVVIFGKVFTQYEEAYTKAGTLELSNSKFSPSKINKAHYQLTRNYKALRQGWDNLLTALSDDWEIDLLFYRIIYADLREYHISTEELGKRIENNILKQLNEIINILEGIRKRIEGLPDDDLKVKEAINSELNTIRQQLSSTVLMSINELILAQDLPALVNNLESKIDRLVSSVDGKRGIVKGLSFEQPIKSSSIYYISPYELIHFESWPQLVRGMKDVKITITESLSKSQNEIIGLGQIAEFNLESALSLFDNESKTDNPKTIAAEGINRTIEKVKNIKSLFESLEKKVEEELLADLQKFNESLVLFTDNENIYEIRVRIAKGKALQKSKELKERVVYQIKNFIPTAFLFVKTTYFKGSDLVGHLFKKYGIASESDDISAELADFLAETQASIEKLPFVYQRLFKAEPLTDINFFEGRTEELQALNNAYNNWMKGRFAAAVVIGEKGSGVTTLLNFFLKELSTSSKVYRFSPETNMVSLIELIEYFSIQFEREFTTLNDIVIFLNESKKLVIIENIQKLYLKKVNGFDAIKWLTELISLTSKKVFWITTCTLYAYDYLDKTIHLSDHFNYPIPVREFDDATIINIINKRHRVSGYNIQFEPSAEELNNKKFKKLQEEQQQEMLRDRYFSELNRIAKSNVSLGLVYWLRSTRQIEGNTIFIGSLKEIDFSFMKALSANKTFSLAIILFHDGLTEAEYCAVTGNTTRKARTMLYPLFEDGILIQMEDRYHINPLLYRQTVMLLKSKNLIH